MVCLKQPTRAWKHIGSASFLGCLRVIVIDLDAVGEKFVADLWPKTAEKTQLLPKLRFSQLFYFWHSFWMTLYNHSICIWLGSISNGLNSSYLAIGFSFYKICWSKSWGHIDLVSAQIASFYRTSFNQDLHLLRKLYFFCLFSSGNFVTKIVTSRQKLFLAKQLKQYCVNAFLPLKSIAPRTSSVQ